MGYFVLGAMGGDDLNDVFSSGLRCSVVSLMGQCLGVAQLRESRTLVNMGNQPHCDEGEGEVTPLPYPLGQATRNRDESRTPNRNAESPSSLN